MTPTLSPEEVEALIWRLKAGVICTGGNCRVMNAKSGCDCAIILDTIADLRRQLAEAYESNVSYQTVNRIWAALGCKTYEDAGGKEISELVADLRRERDEAQEHITELMAACQNAERAGERAGEELVGLTTALRLAERQSP